MARIPKALVIVLAGAILAPVAHADWPAWMDRWLFNAEERTQRGTDSLAAKDYSQAAASMDTAMRLAPEDATATFNAGTARLPVDPEEGRRLLQAAGSQSADPNLVSLAHFNAGNSYLEAGELESAIESFKESLRRNPDHDDAKFNLELAQKRLEEQQQEQQNQDQQSQDQQNQDQQNQDQQNQDQQNQDQQDQDQQDQEQEQQEQEQDSEDQEQQDPGKQDQQSSEDEQEQQEQQQNQQEQQQDPGPQDPEQKESPLPEFSDLPDMTAEEAAAILEAIENMEREQRRQEALEAAKAGIGGKKDW